MAIKKKQITPRQKMINLMYVILMAMLALNISTEVLNGFSIVEESINRTTANSAEENSALYARFEQQMKTNPEKVSQWFAKAIDITELFLLCESCTCHTGLLVKLVEKVLECDCGKGLALSLNLYMLLCLDSLMQSVRITASRHDTSGKLIYDKHLIILYHIVLIFEHEVVRTKRKYDIVLDFKILRICKVLDMEELFYLFHTILCKVYDLVLLIYDEITGLILDNAHDGIHL